MWPVACGLWPVACGLWPVACGLWPVACGLWPVACGLWSKSMLYGLWFTRIAYGRYLRSKRTMTWSWPILYSYGLYAYGLYSHGVYSYDAYLHTYIVIHMYAVARARACVCLCVFRYVDIIRMHVYSYGRYPRRRRTMMTTWLCCQLKRSRSTVRMLCCLSHRHAHRLAILEP